MKLRLVGAFAVGALSLAASGCLGSSGGSGGVSEAGACPAVGGPGTATVPKVVNRSFTSALARLLDDHLLVSVPHFIPFRDAMAEQGWGRLANYTVVSETPQPGTTRPAGTVVTLELSNPLFHGQIGSMAEPVHHPRYARIPDLVGRTYPRAMAAATSKSGILVRVSTTAPLRPAVSGCGLGAFIVSTQSPGPGSRVPWGGVETTGVDPGLATVTISLTARPSATSAG